MEQDIEKYLKEHMGVRLSFSGAYAHVSITLDGEEICKDKACVPYYP